MKKILCAILAVVSICAYKSSNAYPITVNVPERGYVSLQISDSKGEVVSHAVSADILDKGERTIEWDMRDTIEGGRLPVGKYSYKAILIPDHSLIYQGCFYPFGSYSDILYRQRGLLLSSSCSYRREWG